MKALRAEMSRVPHGLRSFGNSIGLGQCILKVRSRSRPVWFRSRSTQCGVAEILRLGDDWNTLFPVGYPGLVHRFERRFMKKRWLVFAVIGLLFWPSLWRVELTDSAVVR